MWSVNDDDGDDDTACASPPKEMQALSPIEWNIADDDVTTATHR